MCTKFWLERHEGKRHWGDAGIWPYLSSGGQSLASQCGSLGSGLGQAIWDMTQIPGHSRYIMVLL